MLWLKLDWASSFDLVHRIEAFWFNFVVPCARASLAPWLASFPLFNSERGTAREVGERIIPSTYR